jgi:hypothetical protein
MIAFTHRCRSALLLLFFAGVTAQLCSAHAILMDSTPKLSSTVKGPDLDINLRFNLRIDGSRSRISLIAPDGTTSTLTLASQSKPNVLQARATGLKPGAYKLQWQVLASDGHMSRGEIPFAAN